MGFRVGVVGVVRGEAAHCVATSNTTAVVWRALRGRGRECGGGLERGRRVKVKVMRPEERGRHT